MTVRTSKRSELVAGMPTLSSYIVNVSFVAREIGGVHKPLRGLLQPAAHSVEAAEFGRPAELLAGLGVVGPQPLHFAVGGPQPRLVGLDLELGAHHLGDHLRGIADRNLESAAEIDGLAEI